MLPKFTYTNPPSFSLIRSRLYKKFINEYKNYFFRYFLFNLIGDCIDKTIGTFLSNKFIFIRANADHFGNWNCIILYMRSQLNTSKKIYFVLGKKHTIDNYWLKYLNYKNLKIIYNPLFRFLLSGFFFSTKVSIDVNGHVACSFSSRNSFYKNFKRMKPIDSLFLNTYKIHIPELLNTNIDFLEKPYILFYARSGNWIYSTNNSIRNMSDINKRKILSSINSKYNIFLIGDTNKNLIEDFKNVYSFNDLKHYKIELDYIYSKASCIIGSISGATHFPSTLFNLSTLYIGNYLVEQLGPLYLYSENIPFKDKYLILSDKQLNEIDDEIFSKFINNFIKNKSLPNIEAITSYKYVGDQNGEYTLYKQESQNLLVHNSLNIKLFGISK